MSTDWGIMVGFALGALWACGVMVAITPFRRKPRSMKQVAGDNSTQIQSGGDLHK